jgi:rare lipoprotein A
MFFPGGEAMLDTKLPIIMGLSIALIGCQATMNTTSDQAAAMPDAVPKIEPKSKYGNMDSYVVFGQRFYTLKTSFGYVRRGVASWYGPNFHGRKTSSGEVYDMHAMTGAHKTLPLPTYAQVTNLENGRQVVIKINDRGPFHDDRLIDLSYSAAAKLGIVKPGTARVEVRSIDPRDQALAGFTMTTPHLQQASSTQTARQQPAIMPAVAHPVTVDNKATASIYLQLGAFSDRHNAEGLKDWFSTRFAEQVKIIPTLKDNVTLFKVYVGPVSSTQRANALSDQLVQLGLPVPKKLN